MTCSEVIYGKSALALDSLQRTHMTGSQVAHMDIVAHSRSVGCVVVVAKHAELFSLAHCHLCDVRHEVVWNTVKGISIDTDGTVKNFAMNDKCAAGTGRFYEAMARSFEMSLPEFSNLSLTAKNVIPITAQCTVFAESEVITLVGEGKPMDEIAAGIQMAVAKRCFVMSKKAGATDAITLTGGCAKNAGLKQAIEHVLKLKVIDLKTDPQLMGALGAAEYARQKGMAKA